MLTEHILALHAGKKMVGSSQLAICENSSDAGNVDTKESLK